VQFDPNNPVIKLCAQGMEFEANQKPCEAEELFLKAWHEATNDFEKFTAAHYVARYQKSVEDKLNWDKTALAFALKIADDSMSANYPSLYLNIGKCYEDLGDRDNARNNYQAALSFADSLSDDGYGQMIKSGIRNGLKRLSES
jgi:rifampin ADP-ribosylating transferase